MHQLKRIYNNYIRQEYGVYVGGDKSPERTEAVAQRVNALGISYKDFVCVSVQLWHDWAMAKEWKYPYWNVISSDKAFERISAMMEYADIVHSSSSDSQNQFLSELEYASAYIRWFGGISSTKPRLTMRVDTSVKIAVAEYLCDMYGVTCCSSNYNDVARKVMDSHGR